MTDENVIPGIITVEKGSGTQEDAEKLAQRLADFKDSKNTVVLLPEGATMQYVFQPGVTHIGHCVEYFITDGEGHWLIHERGPECRDEQGRWDFGGGAQEYGEDRFTALCREVEEEWGFMVTLSCQLPGYSCFRTINGVTSHWEVAPYVVWVQNHIPQPMEGPGKIASYHWLTYEELLSGVVQPFHTAVPFVLKRYENEFKHFCHTRIGAIQLAISGRESIRTRPLFSNEDHPNYNDAWADYRNGICVMPGCTNPRSEGEELCASCR